MNFFVTAIGTDSGKTLASAILAEALKADYWKPVQAGYPTDTETVRKLVSNEKSIFHSERHLLKMPASPHAAAKDENIHISLDDFQLPKTDNSLMVEGAGGMLVPLNDEDYVIDIAPSLDLEIILVSNFYLGNINHTLLSIEYLKQKELPVRGVIFNGPPNPESERIIKHKMDWPVLLNIVHEEKVDKAMVKKYAEMINKNELI